jgi:hypothetical protein
LLPPSYTISGDATRARREKGEIEAVGWRGDSDNTLDLGPAHQQLHRDPGTE